MSADWVPADGSVLVTADVLNAGSRAGDEVVQMYVRHLGVSDPRPRLSLAGFRREHFEPGESRSIAARQGCCW